jgi:hypothetical protein
MAKTKEDYAKLVEKLLAKAESTEFPEEAKSFTESAQAIMAKWAIDEAMLNEIRGLKTDVIGDDEIIHYGNFSWERYMLSYWACHYNGVKCVLIKDSPRMVDGKLRKNNRILVTHGFKSDQERAKWLASSLQVQAMSAQTKWWKDNRHLYDDKKEEWLGRRQFIISFTNEVANKLAEATERGRKQAAKDWANYDGSEGEMSTSMEMVIVSREQQVEKYMEDMYGDSLRPTRSGRKQRGDRWAAEAGRAAGRAADVGQPGVGGGKKQIGK